MNEVRLRAGAEAIRQLNELIYSKPEDVNPVTGRKLWERTGRLKAEEFASLEDHGNDSVRVVLVNHMPYAEPRHEANKPGRRRINPYRTAHWRDATVQKLRPVMARMLQDANHRWLAAGGTEQEENP